MATQPLTLRALFTGKLGRFGDRPAVVHGAATMTYRDLDRQMGRLARGLASFGIGPGDAVAVMMSNRAEFLISDQAIIALGAVKVPVNHMLAATEIAFILADSGAKVAIADAGLLPAALSVASGDGPLRHVITVDKPAAGAVGWAEVLASADGDEPPAAQVDADSPAIILYTGGTTGRQKGVVHTQRGLAVNLLAHVAEIGLLDDERLLLTTPLPHSAGLLAQAGMLKGGIIYLDDKFDVDRVLEHLSRDRITFTFMVPTMIYRLLDRLGDSPADATSLRTILYGAAPILRERLVAALTTFGPVFMQLYGQSEAPNFITRLTRQDHDLARPEKFTSCGRAALLMDIAILHEDGRPVSAGRPGEICVSGPYVMARYHNLPDTTATTLRGGWLHTGDIGLMDDDGFVFLLDRKNDMIITGGMNVYCTEVENVLQACPGIAQVAVVGLPHPDWGEAVAAFVVPEDGGFDERVATAHCRATLAAYKRPKQYCPVETLPTTPFGKIDKKALRAIADPLVCMEKHLQ